MVTVKDYPANLIQAARMVMLELSRLLGEYSDSIVIVGGWVPELIIPQGKNPHIGSIDVDLALNHQSITADNYKTILDLMLERGYKQGTQPFIFYRDVIIDKHQIAVQVDLLAGEYLGTGPSHRTQQVQDLRPRKARGADIAFLNPIMADLAGELPEGGRDHARIQVASIPAFIIMKGFALRGRLKEKDSWDIYYCLRHFPGGIEKLIKEMEPLKKNKLAVESLGIIAEKFSSPESVGPVHVVNFDEITNPEEREQIQRDAYERVRVLLSGVGVGQYP